MEDLSMINISLRLEGDGRQCRVVHSTQGAVLLQTWRGEAAVSHIIGEDLPALLFVGPRRSQETWQRSSAWRGPSLSRET
eukprot:5489498-Pyramimonas_sp.AAC.1